MYFGSSSAGSGQRIAGERSGFHRFLDMCLTGLDWGPGRHGRNTIKCLAADSPKPPELQIC